MTYAIAVTILALLLAIAAMLYAMHVGAENDELRCQLRDREALITDLIGRDE